MAPDRGKKEALVNYGQAPSHDQIAQCAYFLWEKSGHNHGCHVEHWTEAEKMLREQSQAYDLVIKDAGENELQLIRALRTEIGLDIKSAKTLVEKAPQPCNLSLSKPEADKLLQKLQTAGAQLEIKRKA